MTDRISYEETKKIIQDIPQSWCPAILKLLIEVCEEKKVFKPGRIAHFVAGQESYIEGRGCDSQPIKPDGSNAGHYQLE